MSRFSNEYEYDYERIAQDTDDLYEDNSCENDEVEKNNKWEDYYHNLANDIEIIDY